MWVRRGSSKKGSRWWVSHFWVGREYTQLWVSPPSSPQPPRELGRSEILLQLQREALSCQTGAALGMWRSRAEIAFHNTLSWNLLSPDKSIHTPEGRALSLVGPFGLASKAKEPSLKGRTMFLWNRAHTDHLKSTISFCPAAHSRSAGWNLMLQLGPRVGLEQCKKGVEHSLSIHHHAGGIQR